MKFKTVLAIFAIFISTSCYDEVACNTKFVPAYTVSFIGTDANQDKNLCKSQLFINGLEREIYGSDYNESSYNICSISGPHEGGTFNFDFRAEGYEPIEFGISVKMGECHPETQARTIQLIPQGQTCADGYILMDQICVTPINNCPYPFLEISDAENTEKLDIINCTNFCESGQVKGPGRCADPS